MAAKKFLLQVVDDDSYMRKLLSTFLVTHGYNVNVASDGNEAVALIERNPPHLLITDLNMPNLNGFELTRYMQGNERTKHIPIIVLTAEKQSDEFLQSVDEFMIKPFELITLLGKIEGLLNGWPLSLKAHNHSHEENNLWK